MARLGTHAYPSPHPLCPGLAAGHLRGAPDRHRCVGLPLLARAAGFGCLRRPHRRQPSRPPGGGLRRRPGDHGRDLRGPGPDAGPAPDRGRHRGAGLQRSIPGHCTGRGQERASRAAVQGSRERLPLPPGRGGAGPTGAEHDQPCGGGEDSSEPVAPHCEPGPVEGVRAGQAGRSPAAGPGPGPADRPDPGPAAPDRRDYGGGRPSQGDCRRRQRPAGRGPAGLRRPSPGSAARRGADPRRDGTRGGNGALAGLFRGPQALGPYPGRHRAGPGRGGSVPPGGLRRPSRRPDGLDPDHHPGSRPPGQTDPRHRRPGPGWPGDRLAWHARSRCWRSAPDCC